MPVRELTDEQLKRAIGEERTFRYIPPESRGIKWPQASKPIVQKGTKK